jgi:hypothetical protein
VNRDVDRPERPKHEAPAADPGVPDELRLKPAVTADPDQLRSESSIVTLAE